MLKDIPKIISAAAKSPLGIWALIIVILGLVALGFFHQAPIPSKVGIYIFMFIGLGIFGFVVSRVEIGPSDSSTELPDNVEVRASDPPTGVPDVSETLSEARRMLDSAIQYSLLGRNDQAREAFAEARTLYRAVEDRLGEANVLSGLGDLERNLGRNDQAREAFAEARTLYRAVEDRLGEANVLSGLGDLERNLERNDQAREAFAEARTLYRAVENRLGEANVLLGLGHLECNLGRNEQAKRNYNQAAHVYEALGMEEFRKLALKSAETLGGQND